MSRSTFSHLEKSALISTVIVGTLIAGAIGLDVALSYYFLGRDSSKPDAGDSIEPAAIKTNYSAAESAHYFGKN